MQDFRNLKVWDKLTIAIGSASETEYHIILAHDLGYINDTSYDLLMKDMKELKSMLVTLYKKIKTKS